LFLSSRHQHFFHKKGTNPSSARHPMIGRRVESFFVVAALLALLVPLSATEPAEPSNEQSPEVEKSEWQFSGLFPYSTCSGMLSYADLMNNFGGPSPLDFFGAPGNSLFMLDEERPKRELEEADDEVLGLWKRSPRGFLNGGQRNYLMKKDEFVAPGVLRFGKRMPGV
jgi:hypothetical protein